MKKIYLGFILVLMYVPIVLVILYSFNASRLTSVWGGFSLGWYRELFRDRAMFEALGNSLILALLSSLFSAVIGTLGAVGLAWRGTGNPGRAFPLGKIMEYLAILPIMTPEVIMGMVLLAFFTLLKLPLGMITLVLAHTGFCIPYVYLLVKARLAGLDRTYIEAARNLGAGQGRAFRDILFPLIMPAVVSGILLSFAMSFDDVIISVFVTGPQTNTLPVRIYTQMKTGVTPKTNALCSLLFVITVLLCILSAAVSRIKPLEHVPVQDDSEDSAGKQGFKKGEFNEKEDGFFRAAPRGDTGGGSDVGGGGRSFRRGGQTENLDPLHLGGDVSPGNS